jgi:hypothetical protein
MPVAVRATEPAVQTRAIGTTSTASGLEVVLSLSGCGGQERVYTVVHCFAQPVPVRHHQVEVDAVAFDLSRRPLASPRP